MKCFTKIAFLLFLIVSFQAKAQQWHTDFEQAKAIAQKEGKNILLVFSGSDWCAPCIKLEKSVFESDAFKSEAAAKWVLVKADFPKKKANALPEAQQQHNAALIEKYNREGTFPLVVILDANGKVLGKTTYKNITPQEYINQLHAFETK